MSTSVELQRATESLRELGAALDAVADEWEQEGHRLMEDEDHLVIAGLLLGAASRVRTVLKSALEPYQ